MTRKNIFSRPVMWSYLLIYGTAVFFSLSSQASEPILGFRDLKFGMTKQEVSALEVCSTSTECMYELTDKNRYVNVRYQPEHQNPNPKSSDVPRLAKITIDMGAYTENWHQQLQVILGNSYRLTQDITDDALQAFLGKRLNELNAGYEDGQVILRIVRRKFGNLVIKVVYQNSALAMDFTETLQTSSTSSN